MGARRAPPAALGALAAVCCLCGSASASAGAKSADCGVPGRSYAGVHDARVARGIQTSIASLTSPVVLPGLVAAWVGVGGVGEGAGGTDAWIQVGLASSADGVTDLYYEVKRPHRGPLYTEIRSDVAENTDFRIALLQSPAHPGSWRVWADGAPASPLVSLPGSARWSPTATVEMWRDPAAPCYRFAFRFDQIEIATSSGEWVPVAREEQMRDPGFRMRFANPSSLVVSSLEKRRLPAERKGGVRGP